MNGHFYWMSYKLTNKRWHGRFFNVVNKNNLMFLIIMIYGVHSALPPA